MIEPESQIPEYAAVIIELLKGRKSIILLNKTDLDVLTSEEILSEKTKETWQKKYKEFLKQ